MNTLKPVRLLHAWQFYPKGFVFTAMPAAQAQVMVEAGQAEYVPTGAAAEKALTSPVDRMMRPAQTVTKQQKRARSPAGGSSAMKEI